MRKIIKIWNVGNITYGSALKLQTHIANLHFINDNNNVKDTLLILEHPPVYTTGIRTKEYTNDEANRLKGLGMQNSCSKFLFLCLTISFD